MLSASSMRMRRAYTVGFCIIVLILLFDTRILIQERNQGKGRYIYTTMPGIFKTSDEEMNHEKYDFFKAKIGLVDRVYPVGHIPSDESTDWARLWNHVSALNEEAKDGAKYKLFFLLRAGESWHNVGELKYGMDSWEDYWSKKEGDEKLQWADAKMTDYGDRQAARVHEFFNGQIGMPKIDSFYVSPLTRCLQMAKQSWSKLKNGDQPFHGIVKENLREMIGVRTCDRRSSISRLKEIFPESFMKLFTFEEGMTDKDELWTPNKREFNVNVQDRVRGMLDDIFDKDPGHAISFTSHQGTIRAFTVVVNHRHFPIPEGSILAILVKAVKAGP